LNNGVVVPSLGFGVFQIPNEQTEAAIESALATGYRLIDTAAAYFNEREVGAAIRRSGIDRSDGDPKVDQARAHRRELRRL